MTNPGIIGLYGTPPQAADRASWATNSAYVRGDVATYSGARWMCVTPHQAGATFDTTRWVLLSPDPKLKPLQRFWQALGQANTAPVDILALGDSLTEGTGVALGVGTGFIDKRFITRLGKLLAARYTDVGTCGVGFVNCSSNVVNGSGGGTAYWTFSGGGSFSNVGFLGNRTRNFAADETGTFVLTGTSFQIHYIQGVAATVPFTLTVDGGAPITVTPATTGGQRSTGVYTSATLAAGSHTIVCTPTATKQLFVLGGFVYNGNDGGVGIRVWDDGLFGQTSTTALAAQAGIGSAGGGGLTNPLAVFTPALVIIEYGLNEYTTGVAPDTYRTNLQQIIANVKSLATVTPSFLILTPYQGGAVAAPTYPWSQYIAAANAVAAADPTNVLAINLAERIPTPVSGNAYANGIINTDQVHPTAGGHNYLAQVVGTVVAPA